MSASDRTGRFLHPLHALLLAFPIALFTGALAADVTYLRTAVPQWSHFASWLIAGALLFGGVVLAWAAVRLFRWRARTGRGRALAYLVLVAAMWLAGLLNAFQHSRDAWSSVGATGLALSTIATILALIAGWIAHSAPLTRGDSA